MKNKSPGRAKKLTPALLAVGMVAASIAGPANPVGAQAGTSTPCGVAPAGFNVIVSNASLIRGTTGPDFICAGAGNNTIRAMGMNDIIHGGAGNDRIFGGFGNDTIFGGTGNDNISAGSGLDTVDAGAGDDIVLAGNGPDVVNGGDGADQLTGGNGHDMLRGNGGNDRLVGNMGLDTLIGDNGNDVLQGGIGNDTISGGNGADNINGGDSDDTLFGGNGNDLIQGGNGADRLTGGSGNDTLRGQGNPDVLLGSDGNDTIDGGNGLNRAVGGNGSDVCFNAAQTGTACEILDGVDLSAPTQTIVATFPNGDEGNVNIQGRNWDVTFAGEERVEITFGGLRGTATTTANGTWAVTGPANRAFGANITADNISTTQVLETALESFSYNARTQDLTVTGTPMQTIRILVNNAAGTLIFLEQITFDASGNGSTNLSEVSGLDSIDISRQDSDGDIEFYQNVHE